MTDTFAAETFNPTARRRQSSIAGHFSSLKLQNAAMQNAARQPHHLHDATADATLGSTSGQLVPQQSNMGAARQSSSKNIAWRCGACSYNMLAMDHLGNPLPLEKDAFGKPLPLQCPRCAIEHSKWEQALPFDSHGDYTGIRSSFANSISATVQSNLRRQENDTAFGEPAPLTGALLPVPTAPLTKFSDVTDRKIPAVLQNIGTVTYRNDTIVQLAPKKAAVVSQPMAYYCGPCGRRMQRVDQFGKLVPLEVDPFGKVVPLTCPGCKHTHSDWVTKPFLVGAQ